MIRQQGIPAFKAELPYAVVMVELEEGPMVFGSMPGSTSTRRDRDGRGGVLPRRGRRHRGPVLAAGGLTVEVRSPLADTLSRRVQASRRTEGHGHDLTGDSSPFLGSAPVAAALLVGAAVVPAGAPTRPGDVGGGLRDAAARLGDNIDTAGGSGVFGKQAKEISDGFDETAERHPEQEAEEVAQDDGRLLRRPGGRGQPASTAGKVTVSEGKSYAKALKVFAKAQLSCVTSSITLPSGVTLPLGCDAAVESPCRGVTLPSRARASGVRHQPELAAEVVVIEVVDASDDPPPGVGGPDQRAVDRHGAAGSRAGRRSRRVWVPRIVYSITNRSPVREGMRTVNTRSGYAPSVRDTIVRIAAAPE